MHRLRQFPGVGFWSPIYNAGNAYKVRIFAELRWKKTLQKGPDGKVEQTERAKRCEVHIPFAEKNASASQRLESQLVCD